MIYLARNTKENEQEGRIITSFTYLRKKCFNDNSVM